MSPLSPLALPATALPRSDAAAPESAGDGGFAALLGELAPDSAIPATAMATSVALPRAGQVIEAPVGEPAAPELNVPELTSLPVPVLPEGGKNLPSRLPVAELETRPDEGDKATPARPRKDNPAIRHRDDRASPQAVLPDAALAQAAPIAQQQAAAFLAVREGVTAPQADPALTAVAVAPATLAEADVHQAIQKDLSATMHPALPQRTRAALPDMAKPQVERSAESKPRPAAMPLVTSLAPPAAGPATAAIQPLAQVPQPDPATPAIVAPVRQILAAARREEEPGTPRAVATATPSLPLQAEAAPPSVSAPRLQVEAPVSRPLDFAALVDRLTAAREAAAPQTVSIALPHAEFGRVALRFHHDDLGLAVSMASPDPDFARAAAQALPPVQQASAIESFTATSQQQSGNLAERGASGGGDQSALARQQAREPRDERDAGRPTNQSSVRDDRPERPRRQGIFA